jgi:hypothetical protein
MVSRRQGGGTTPNLRRAPPQLGGAEQPYPKSERQAHPTEDAHGPGTARLDRGRKRPAGDEGMEGQDEEHRQDDHERRAVLPPWDTGRLKGLARLRHAPVMDTHRHPLQI